MTSIVLIIWAVQVLILFARPILTVWQSRGCILPNVRQIARFVRLRALHWLLVCSPRASDALGTIASCLAANRLITSNCAITIITWVVWASSIWPNPMGTMGAMAIGQRRICGALPIRSNARAKCTPGIPKHRRGLITTFWRKKGCSVLLSMIIPAAPKRVITLPVTIRFYPPKLLRMCISGSDLSSGLRIFPGIFPGIYL